MILTNGTFLNGLIHVGEKQFGGGRVGEKASFGITENLTSLGFVSGRMKTGHRPGLMEGLLIITKWKSNRVTSILENFLISLLANTFKTKKLLRYIYQP